MRVVSVVLTLLVFVLGAEVLRLETRLAVLEARPSVDVDHAEMHALRHQVKEELTSIRTRLNWDEATECPNGRWIESKYDDAQKALDHYNKTASSL